MNRHLCTALPILLTLLCSVSLAQDAEEAPAAPVMQDPEQEQMHEAAVMGKPGDVLTPLSVGNTWVYENPADGVINTDRIVGVVEFDGRPWYLLRSGERAIDAPQGTEPEFITELWLSQHAGVAYDAQPEVDESTGRLQLTQINAYFRYPAAEGQVYQPNPDDPGLKVEVVGINVQVNNKAGAFVCVAYQETHTDDPGYSYTSYVAPGVGLVRYTTTFEGEASNADLVRYELMEAE